MSTELRLGIFAFAVILVLIVFQILKKGRVPVKYSLIWFLSAAIMMVVSLFPNFLCTISSMLGFVAMSNMIIGVMIAILLFISISLTIIVSGQKEKIKLLIQEISLIKQEIDKK